MSRIKRLPEDVHNSVRSTVVISDLVRVVEELVFNSLEAGATKVFGAVGVGSCYVKVVDNGSGITRDELVLLGERYATSKVDHMAVTNTECFDFHGEALSSISHVSLLEIVTKARGKANGYKKIIKDCKCLFLGINDDMQAVGTTVTARDIFYNQPVRRKHMESSPKKVLDSIKMSVLRIALVHVNVSFKVVDVESTSELLYTMPSPSPLPILFSNFGIGNPSDFYKLDISNGALKLSGYISGPRESFSLKAIQYVYINSRFICKGPIHKILNQLADKFDLLNSWKPTTGSQREKQNKCHMCPTFILNVNCPRSYYDIVTSELSRTTVEFKDWDSVLSFIESGVKHLWNENISHDMPAISESGRKRRREKNCQTSLDLSSSQLKRPSRNNENFPPWEEYLCTRQKQSAFSELKKHQNEILYSLDTDSKSQSCDGSLASHRVTRNALVSSNLPPCSVFSPERHQFVACKSGKQEDGIPASPSVDILPKFEDDITVSSRISAGYLEFRDDIPINHDMKKSSLRSCSFPRSFHDTTRAASDERSEFGMDDFRVTKNWIGWDDSIVDEAGQMICGREIENDGLPPFQESSIQHDIHDITVSSGISADYSEFRDDIPINHDMKKSSLRSCSFPRSSHDTTRAAGYGRSEFGMNDFRVTKKWIDCDDSIVDEAGQIICGREIQNDGSPPFQISPAFQHDIHDRQEFPRVDWAKSSLVSRNIQPYTSEMVQKCSSSHQYFGPEWSPITEEQSATIRFQEDDVSYRIMDDSQSEFGKKSIQRYTWREDVPVDSHLSKEESWQQHNSSIMNFSPFAKGCTYRKGEIAEFLLDDFENSLSPNPSKRLSRKDWLYLRSDDEETLKNISMPSLYDTTSKLHGCGRPNRRGTMYNKRESLIRSHSAPPFYKGKKRFLDLSDSSTILSAKSNTRIISRVICGQEPSNLDRTQLHAEASNLKYPQKSNDLYQPSRMDRSDADCSFAQRPSLGKTPEVSMNQSGITHHRDQIINRKYGESSNLKEIQDSFNSGGKWRNCLPTAGGPAQYINKDQDTILAISSDILYLSGDSLVPKSIDKTLLDSAKVLNQVDKKFIAVVGGKTLAVIDQHAADERIRLEELRHKVLSGEMKTITYLEDEKELVLPEVGYQLLHNYAEQIQAWGWICNIHSHDASSFTKNLDFLHRQPSFVKLVAVPCILGVNLTDIDLLEFLQQLADTDGSSTIPPSVHHILNNKACRGAIMFGDTLLPSECSLVVEELKRTSLCFQCAHGRPTTVPLVNLDVLHNNIAKRGSHEFRHGLRQHKISLERSLRRLRSAQC